MIYFDNAATTVPKPRQVIDAVSEAMANFGNAGRGIHSSSLASSRCIYETRSKLAQLIHAKDPSRVAFTSNATEALNIAIQGVLGPQDHAITTMAEHNSVLRPLYRLEKEGMGLSIVRCDQKGRYRIEEMEKMIRPNTKAIITTHASNLTGNVYDIAKIGALAHLRGLIFIVDASQTAGIFPIDVEKMQIDILCMTGHKGLWGPQGTGAIYVRAGVDVRPLKVGGSGIKTFDQAHPEEMPTRLEAGTLNSHGIAGLGAALDYLNEIGIEKIGQKEKQLYQYALQGLRKIEGLTLYGDVDAPEHAAIIAFNLEGFTSGELGDLLMQEYGIANRSGGHCAPLMHEALGTEKNGAVRISFSHLNTTEEIDVLIQALEELTE